LERAFLKFESVLAFLSSDPFPFGLNNQRRGLSFLPKSQLSLLFRWKGFFFENGGRYFAMCLGWEFAGSVDYLKIAILLELLH